MRLYDFRAFQEYPFWKGPWRNTFSESREDAENHSNAAIVQKVSMGSPTKITNV